MYNTAPSTSITHFIGSVALCLSLSLPFSSHLITAIKLDLLSLNHNPLPLSPSLSLTASLVFGLSHSPQAFKLNSVFAGASSLSFTHSPAIYSPPIFNFHPHFRDTPPLSVSPPAPAHLHTPFTLSLLLSLTFSPPSLSSLISSPFLLCLCLNPQSVIQM